MNTITGNIRYPIRRSYRIFMRFFSLLVHLVFTPIVVTQASFHYTKQAHHIASQTIDKSTLGLHPLKTIHDPLLRTSSSAKIAKDQRQHYANIYRHLSTRRRPLNSLLFLAFIENDSQHSENFPLFNTGGGSFRNLKNRINYSSSPFRIISKLSITKSRMTLSSSPSKTSEEDYTVTKNNENDDDILSKRRRIDNDDTISSNWKLISEKLEKRANGMNERTKQQQPFTDDEWNDVKQSIDNVMLGHAETTNDNDATPSNDFIDPDQLYQFLQEVGHLSHKDWSRTGTNGQRLGQILSLQDISSSAIAQSMLHRILNDGNWNGAIEYAKNLEKEDDNNRYRPWAVLVTGVNGIRKTTSIYQSWFPTLLMEALVPPKQDIDDSKDAILNVDKLPIGSNSFFRQLDHMIATLCNVDFRILYQYASELMQYEEGQQLDDDKHIIPSKQTIKQYSDLKAAIFTRYRTLSELLGAHLLYEAQKCHINCMLETSGRDVAMFHYIDHFFSDNMYRKLALHFTINDLSLAQYSVDQRMIHEIQAGIKAISCADGLNNNLSTIKAIRQIIQTNEGGPYGSEVLPDIQKDSDHVWNDIIMSSSSSSSVGQDWYKASIQINAHPTESWTAQAIRPDGTLGTLFTFEKREIG